MPPRTTPTSSQRRSGNATRRRRRASRTLRGVAFSEKGGNVKVEVGGLFEAARRMGRTPLYALAHFLITANFGERKDCYRVWVACAEDDEG